MPNTTLNTTQETSYTNVPLQEAQYSVPYPSQAGSYQQYPPPEAQYPPQEAQYPPQGAAYSPQEYITYPPEGYPYPQQEPYPQKEKFQHNIDILP